MLGGDWIMFRAFKLNLYCGYVSFLFVVCTEAYAPVPYLTYPTPAWPPCRIFRSSALRRRNDFQEEEEDEYYYDTRPVGHRSLERDLREFPFEGDFDDDPYQTSLGNRAEREPSRYSEDDFERWEYEEGYEEAPEDEAGNFWYNPRDGLDVDLPVARTTSGPSGERPASTAEPHRRRTSRGRPSKTTFRSGTPPPPEALTDLYNRLFWYGFDPADTTSPSDPTMFGGTKGKFNGLAYLRDGVGVMPKGEERRRPRNEWYEDSSEDNNEGDDVPVRRQPSMKPPFDAPRPMPSQPTPAPRRNPNRKARRRKDDWRGDWVSEEVASWFRADKADEVDDFDDNVNDRVRRRKSRSPWFPFDAVQTFFGFDREDMDARAAEYDRQMGLGDRPSPKHQSPRRRKRYTYRFRDDDTIPAVVEYEVVNEEGGGDTSKDEPDTLESKKEGEANGPSKLSWEDRALAIERVPPPGIAAWGPSGDLGVDARTKAILDALEDLQGARQRLVERRAIVDEARDTVSILRVNSELERKRLRNLMLDAKSVQMKLRTIDRKVEDASRALRLAQGKLKLAEETLEELEARHWAVLSFYNPDKVEEGLREAILEFEENEPAARRFRNKLASEGEGSSSFVADGETGPGGDPATFPDGPPSEIDG